MARPLSVTVALMPPSMTLTLPPEIVGAIFLESRPKKPARYRVPHELVVSHVCRDWREIALGFAQLWSNLEIYSTHSLSWLPTYIQRSKSSPLSVHMDTYEFDKRSFPTLNHVTQLRPVFDLLIEHIDRVQEFFWYTYRVNTIHELSPRLENLAAPALHRLRIAAAKHSHRMPIQLRTLFNGGAPNLDLVDVAAVCILPRLENVTTLMIGMLISDPQGIFAELVKVASNAVNLTHLYIDRIMSYTSPSVGIPTVLMFKSLRSLKLVVEPSPLIADFLRVLRAPQLESLWLGCRPFHRMSSSFQAGSRFPLLRYLTLQNYDFTIPQAIYDAFPSVTHLHLAYPANFMMRINSLFTSDDNRPCWPNLHTLAIRTAHDAFNEEDPTSNGLIYQLGHVLPTRKEMNLEIKTLLLDSDLFRIAAGSGWRDEVSVMERLSPSNYHEHWWNFQEDSTMHIT